MTYRHQLPMLTALKENSIIVELVFAFVIAV